MLRRFRCVQIFLKHNNENVLYLHPMIPPKRFDIFPPDREMLRRSIYVQIFLLTHTHTHQDTAELEVSATIQEIIMYTACAPLLIVIILLLRSLSR